MNKNVIKYFLTIFFIVGITSFVSAETKTLTCDDGTKIQVSYQGSEVTGINKTDKELDLYVNVLFEDGTKLTKVRIHLDAAPTKTTGTGKNKKTEIVGTGSGRRDFGKKIFTVEECP